MTITHIASTVGIISIALNLVLVVMQANLARSIAELKVYMHQNFQPLEKR